MVNWLQFWHAKTFEGVQMRFLRPCLVVWNWALKGLSRSDLLLIELNKAKLGGEHDRNYFSWWSLEKNEWVFWNTMGKKVFGFFVVWQGFLFGFVFFLFWFVVCFCFIDVLFKSLLHILQYCTSSALLLEVPWVLPPWHFTKLAPDCERCS